MLLLWSDILTHTVCTAQAKQVEAQTDKLVPPARGSSQPNRAARRSTPRSADAKALDWEIKDISVHRSSSIHMRGCQRKNKRILRGERQMWEYSHIGTEG